MRRLKKTRTVTLDVSDVAAARSLATAVGVEVQQLPRRGIEPVTTVMLVLVGSTAAVGTVLHGLERRKGGQVIDLRPGSPKAFYRTRDVVYGMVVVAAADGSVTVRVRDPDKMFEQVITALPGLLAGRSSAEQVTRAVTETFGPEVAVASDEIPAPDNSDE